MKAAGYTGLFKTKQENALIRILLGVGKGIEEWILLMSLRLKR